MSSARRPFIAAHVEVATTATPLATMMGRPDFSAKRSAGSSTTFFTPGTASARDAAASGELVEVLRIEAIGLADRDRLPVDGELLRDQQRERRLHAFADLGARREDRHGTVRLDLDERADRDSRVLPTRQPREGDEESSGRRRADLEKRAAIDGGE